MQIQRLEEQCNKCGLCVKDCVAGAWQEIHGRPEMATPEFCNQCGHCVAVCPKDAIRHEGLDLGQIRKVDKNRLDPAVFREIIRSRRSIRRYKEQMVPDETIEDILALSAHSPTASNKQNVAYTVITDPAVLQDISNALFGFARKLYDKTRKGPGKLIYSTLKMLLPGDDPDRYMKPMPYYIEQADQGRDYILHGAPVLILVHAPKKGSFHCENCNIAAANIMNDAHVRGLGTCYIGFLTLALKFSGSLRQRVALPRGRKAYACLVMGYPAYGYTCTTSRKKRNIDWNPGNPENRGSR
ncbi:MAG: nitroreductase family protein [Desulfobacteraceae bacterium]|nr:nitroreductase family protein [Desulfobacteraceae bacterium]